MGSDANLQLIPPSPPVPQTRRQMLWHNAIEAWNTMLGRLAALFTTGEVMTKLTSSTAVFRRELLDR